jgi:NADPH2:quinone reductase
MSFAIVIREPGGPEVMKWEAVVVPEPGKGQVLLRQHAIGLNYIDVYHRSGYYAQRLPFTPGVEGAGVIEAAGPEVADLQVGDRVAYAGPLGAYSERRLAPADRMVKLPERISFDEGAALMLQGMTAQVLLKQVYQVRAGQTILVHAAAGGTGLLLCQWAKLLGATVIGTVSSEQKAALAAAHGCDHPIVYTKQDFVLEVARLTGGKRVPVVYDSVGKDTFLRSLDCLAPRGMLVTFGQASGPVDPIAPVLLSQKGSLYLTRPFLFTYIESRAALQACSQDLFDQVLAGRLRVTINQRIALKDAVLAHQLLESRATTGATVLVG